MQEEMITDIKHSRVLFFDGVCSLCNGVVDWLVRKDKKRLLRYAPLQGNTAKAFGLYVPHEPDTIVYVRNGKKLYRSSAALWLLYDLGGFYRVGAVFLILPAFIRNAVYDFIAKRRYRWFGKHETCRIPSAQERLLFLD
jgi:predicted DCC family thiol-disulfide oxidoreductase YuxK